MEIDPLKPNDEVAKEPKAVEEAARAEASKRAREEDRATAQAAMDASIRHRMGLRTRRSFLAGGIAAAAGYGAWRWIGHSGELGGLPAPLRAGEDFNARTSHALLGTRANAPEYPASYVTEEARVNGDIGLDDSVGDDWRLRVAGLAHPESFRQYTPNIQQWTFGYDPGDEPRASMTDRANSAPNGKLDAKDAKQPANTPAPPISGSEQSAPAGGEAGVLLTLADLAKFSQIEMVTQFKCIEGWSQYVRFSGVRLRDFLQVFGPASSRYRYIALETPDGMFYTGLDLETALHPQTLLCTEMNNQPISADHGSPLRLATPLKYGYKQLKQIGTIRYEETRPRDYWAERGYDWYGGL